MQTIIVHMKLPATILTQGVTNSSGLTDVKTLIDLNRTLIIKEAGLCTRSISQSCV